MKAGWRKSSYSGNFTDEMCVEVGELAGGVGLRDSRDPDGARLELNGLQFAALVGKIKLGVLDRPSEDAYSSLYRWVPGGRVKAGWRKSSYSGSSTDEVCVEVAGLAGGVAIQDSKDPDGGRLSVSGDHFGRLLHRIKAGTFDRPAGGLP